MRKNTKWGYGDRGKIERFLGLKENLLYGYIDGTRQVKDYDMAQKLVHAAAALGYETTVRDWMKSKDTDNPLFKK